MLPKRRKKHQGLYYHSSPPKVLSMVGGSESGNVKHESRSKDGFTIKPSNIRIWIHDKDIKKLTKVLWAGEGNRLRSETSTNTKIKKFLENVPYILNIIKDVHQATIDNDLDTLRAKTKAPVPLNLLKTKDTNGLTVMHKAAGLGYTDIVEYLLSIWPDGASERDFTGRTPLHWAACAKHNARIYNLLVQSGVEEDALDYKKKSPLDYKQKPSDMDRSLLTVVPDAPRVPQAMNLPDWSLLDDDELGSSGKNSITRKTRSIPRRGSNIIGNGMNLLTTSSRINSIDKTSEPEGMDERHDDVSTAIMSNKTNDSPSDDVIDTIQDNGNNAILQEDGFNLNKNPENEINNNEDNTNENNNGNQDKNYQSNEEENENIINTKTKEENDSHIEDKYGEKFKANENNNNTREEIIVKTQNIDDNSNEKVGKEMEEMSNSEQDIETIDKDVTEYENEHENVYENEFENDDDTNKMEKHDNKNIENDSNHDIQLETMENDELTNMENHLTTNINNSEMEIEELDNEDKETGPNEENQEINESLEIKTSDTDTEITMNMENLVNDETLQANTESDETLQANTESDDTQLIEKVENFVIDNNKTEISNNDDDGDKNFNLTNENEDVASSNNDENNNEFVKSPAEDNKSDDVEIDDSENTGDKESVDSNSDDEDDDQKNVQNLRKTKVDHTKVNGHVQNEYNIDSDISKEFTSQPLEIEGIVRGDADDNQVQSQGDPFNDIDEEIRIQQIVNSGNMEQLAALVLNGEGKKLLNVESSQPEIQAFLDNVQNYMNKIRRVHKAAREGNLRELQAALDRRKFAIAKDEISPDGASALHVGTVFGHAAIVRYLAGRFPETTHVVDDNGRTALHYAATINDNGHFYNLLIHLGANPKQTDKFGYSPEFYRNQQEAEKILSYKDLLKRFGANENLEYEMLNDQGDYKEEYNKDLEVPLFKTEQGRYLARTLGDPLVKGLTEIADRRPTDPVQYLANFLLNFNNTKSNKSITKPKQVEQQHQQQQQHQAAPISTNSFRDNTPSSAQSKDISNHQWKENTPKPMSSTSSSPSESPQQNQRNQSSISYGSEDKERDPPTTAEVADNNIGTPDSVADRDEHGQSMLHFACARTHGRNALYSLIDESQINITYRDEIYRTARDVSLQASQPSNAKEIDNYVITLAVRGDLKSFDEMVLEGYDHILDVLDDDGNSLIAIARSRGHHELAKFLEELQSFEENREELHQAIRDKDINKIQGILSSNDAVRLLRAKNYYGRTAVHIAVLKEHEDIVEYLSNMYPAALRIGDNIERTPLHYAMGVNSVETLSRILIKKGAKRTVKDLKGRQPSYYFMNRSEILRLQEEENSER